AVRGEADRLRALRLRPPTDLPQPEPHVARVRRDPEGAGHVDHGTISSNGSSGSDGGGTGAVAAGFGFGTAIGFGSPGRGLYSRFTAPLPRVAALLTITFSARLRRVPG